MQLFSLARLVRKSGLWAFQICIISHTYVSCQTTSMPITVLQAAERKQDAAAHGEAVRQVCQLNAFQMCPTCKCIMCEHLF